MNKTRHLSKRFVRLVGLTAQLSMISMLVVSLYPKTSRNSLSDVVSHFKNYASSCTTWLSCKKPAAKFNSNPPRFCTVHTVENKARFKSAELESGKWNVLSCHASPLCCVHRQSLDWDRAEALVPSIVSKFSTVSVKSILRTSDNKPGTSTLFELVPLEFLSAFASQHRWLLTIVNLANSPSAPCEVQKYIYNFFQPGQLCGLLCHLINATSKN